MNQFAGMSDSHLMWLRGQLAVSQNPLDKIQLERVIAQLKRRGRL